MNHQQWNKRVGSSEAYRRAAGRRLYNGMRTAQKIYRREQVAKLVWLWGWPRGKSGWLKRTAHALGVDASVISRDLKALGYRRGKPAPAPQPSDIDTELLNALRARQAERQAEGRA